MFSTALWILLIVYLAKMVMGRGSANALPPDWARRAEGEITRLRGEVDRLSGEVGRLTEEQSFLLRLLEGPERRPLPPADRFPSPTGEPNGDTRGR